jgi:hypothetical protein
LKKAIELLSINFSNQTTTCTDVELQKANEELKCINKKLENNIIVSRLFGADF